MTLDKLQTKSVELQDKGYKLIHESEDGFFHYLASADNENLISVSADPAASKAFAEMCFADPDNSMLPDIYDEYEDDGLHFTIMERVYSIMEMDGATEGHYGRVGRNYTNFLAGHDPARGSDNDHAAVFEAFAQSRKLQRVGSAIATALRDSRTEEGGTPLVFDRSRENMMYKPRESETAYDFVYMHPLRSLDAHTHGFLERFNVPAEAEEQPKAQDNKQDGRTPRQGTHPRPAA